MSAPSGHGSATESVELARPQLLESEREPRRLSHVRGFDGLRGIAVIIVVVAHLNIILPIPRFLVVPGGVVSLDAFFVLSGFLITSLLLSEHARHGHIHRADFYRRRAFRLLPALFAVLAAHAIYTVVAGLDLRIERDSLISVLFYFSNWRMALTAGAFGSDQMTEGLQHMWSLSFEEQFYLVLPIVTAVGLTYARRLRTVVIVLVSLMALVALHRAQTYAGGTNWYPTFIRTDTRIDAFLPGVLLAHIWFRRREYHRYIPIAGWCAAAFLIVCLVLASIQKPFLYYGGITGIDIACALIVLALLDGRWKATRLFELKWLVALGTVSYALYLWHLPVMFGVRRWGGALPRPAAVAVALGLSLLFAVLSWFLLERPAMRWRRRLEARRREKAAASPTTTKGLASLEAGR